MGGVAAVGRKHKKEAGLLSMYFSGTWLTGGGRNIVRVSVINFFKEKKKEIFVCIMDTYTICLDGNQCYLTSATDATIDWNCAVALNSTD